MKSLLAFLMVVPACSTEPSDRGDVEIVSVETGLPDGHWEGTLTSTPTSFETQNQVSITDNVVLRDFEGGGYVGAALDTFRFRASGVVEWLGPSEDVIGSCAVDEGTFTCDTFADQQVSSHREWRFFATEWQWDELVTLDGATDHWRGVLMPLP